MKKELTIKLGQVADYEIRLLRVFNAVVECGGFAAAATELNIGRSTISVHVANLEQRLNLKLCVRGRGGFSLTEEGVVVHELMQELFTSLDSFRAGINALYAELTGELKILASDTICLDSQAMIPEAIAEFSHHAPDVNVLLDVKGLTQIERMVINNKADIGFIPCHRELEGLDYTPLYTDDFHLYCSVKHPLYDCVDNKKLNQRIQTDKTVHAGIQTHEIVGKQLAGMNKGAISYFYEARLAMILSGAYIGFMPDKYVEEYVKGGELRMLLPKKKRFRLGVTAITRSHGRGNRARTLFVDIVRKLHEAAG